MGDRICFDYRRMISKKNLTTVAEDCRISARSTAVVRCSVATPGYLHDLNIFLKFEISVANDSPYLLLIITCVWNGDLGIA